MKHAILTIFLILASSASAKVITVKVTGVVDSVYTEGGFALDGSVGVGSAMTGYCSYDVYTPDLNPYEQNGKYALISISTTLGNYTFTHNPTSSEPAVFRVYTTDPIYSASSPAPRFDGSILVDGSPQTYDDITWYYTYLELFNLWTSSSEYIPTDVLPDWDSWPEFSVFDMRREFRMRFNDESGRSFDISGDITSLTASTPFDAEPDRIDFLYYPSDPNPQPQTLSIWAQEANTINWEIIEDCNWLDASPANGVSTGQINEVSITVNPNGLAPALYNCNLEIRDTNSVYDSVFIKVFLNAAAVLLVPDDFSTIQAAIDAANDLDIVLVANGTYTGEGNRDIDFLGKAITVRSESGPETCIIDCSGEPHNGFIFQSDEDNNSVLDGFTITGCVNEGGGICCRGGRAGNASPSILDCIITANAGGIYCEHSSPKITGCTINNNSSYFDGGGIHCEDSNAAIINCTITGNSGDRGGGIHCEDSNSTIANCIISGNKAYNRSGGGGISIFGGLCFIYNSTVTGNAANFGGGIKCRYNIDTIITNSILWNNGALEQGPQIALDVGAASLSYTDIQGGQDDAYVWSSTLNWLPGDIDVDPCFVEPGFWTDVNDPNVIYEPNDPNVIFESNIVWIDGDYHLKSKGWRWDTIRQRWDWDDVTSRCIDAGNPGSPLGDEPLSIPEDPYNEWGQNLRINMGAFGRTPEASIPPYDWALLSDMTNDGISDFNDLQILSSLWLNTGESLYADFDRDGDIDFFDFALLADDWLKYTSWNQ